MWKQMLPGLRATLLLTVLTGLLYPLLVTGLCQVLFRDKAEGSLITRNGKVIGSALIGQNFTRAEYFQPRPSAAGNDGYDPTASGGSNLGPSSKKLIERVNASLKDLPRSGPVPADLVTTSASGLDPHLSPASAHWQSARVAAAREVPPSEMDRLIDQYTEGRDLGLLGEPRVNVLLLNLALDERYPMRR